MAPSRNASDFQLLVDDLIRVLPAFLLKRETWTEYDILSALRDNYAPMKDLRFDTPLALFVPHFLLFHALYRIRHEGRLGDGLSLDISPLAISLTSRSGGKTERYPGSADPLSSFYLELNNVATPDEEVSQWLTEAANRLTGRHRVAEAFADLELPADSDVHDAKKQYRRLSLRYHPDRGGCPTAFHRITEAYSVIKSAYGL